MLVPSTSESSHRRESAQGVLDGETGRRRFHLSLRADVRLVEVGAQGLLLHDSSRHLWLPALTDGAIAALHNLAAEGATRRQLLESAARDGSTALVVFLNCIRQITHLGWICHTLTAKGRKLATLVPDGPHGRHWDPRPTDRQLYVLSRFAYLHREGQELRLDCPLGHSSLVLHDELPVTMLGALARARTALELRQMFPHLSSVHGSMLLSLLLSCRAVLPCDETGQEQADPPLAQWALHDLIFHTRTRLGRNPHPYGATNRCQDAVGPLAAVKPPMADRGIPLCRPNLKACACSDPPFTEVLEKRRSIRAHSDVALTADQVGEFLYRTARVRNGAPDTPECTSRPYPSAGACYELELYLAIRACRGLAPGLYHYCPLRHELFDLATPSAETAAVLEQADFACGGEGLPQVLIVIAARFQRVARRYESIAYSLILKDVGVLQQTMCLVATAMGLAGCALGGGDSDTFSVAAGLEYYAETSVGEFMLGTPRDDGRRQ